ncbi:hypothetical protein GCK72_006983 [Caenorhabditis remanei]|uniref:Uncharacterized protein n=1 Tax=Caenorhabditis remanei TaxID=31234 RepID=A0A6A5HHR6_CAERE|nr:hypothetical protein GCK72_006983 [Caenorhabditis remanei]KAF1767025.1 hypothetical protein GCK72_006983 [Caenorhabditis remanei]
MNRAPRTLPFPYQFCTYPLYPAHFRLPSPTPASGLLAVLPEDFKAPWFIEHQIALETASKNFQNSVAAMNVSCQRTNKPPDNKDTENRQLKEQLNVLTQKLQMFTSRKVQDDRQIQQFVKCSTDQVAERNALIEKLQEEKHVLKLEREVMARKIKKYEEMLRNDVEKRRIERENFDSQQKTSKLDLLAHKRHIEELKNEVNELRDFISIQEETITRQETEKDELSMRIENYKRIQSNLKEGFENVLGETRKIRLELEKTRKHQHNLDKEYREDLKRTKLDNDTLTESNEKKNEEIVRLKAVAATTPTKSVVVVRNCQKRHCEDEDEDWTPNSERKKRKIKEEKVH